MRNNSGNSSSSWVSIPFTVRKIILDIKEITNIHTEDDIYAMLRECSMDPNETIQRLVHLDAFHEVKSKRDKRKEIVKSGHQGQGMRGDHGNAFPQFNSADVVVRRNNFARKNAVEDSREKGFKNPHVGKSSPISVDGRVKVPNDCIFSGPHAKSSPVGNGYSADAIISGADQSSTIKVNASAEHALSASNSLLKPSCESKSPSVVGAIKGKARIQQKSSEAVTRIPTNSETESLNNLDLSDTKDLNVSQASSSMVKKEPSDAVKVAHSVDMRECTQDEKCCGLNGDSDVKPSSPQGVEKVAFKPEKLKVSHHQHVIIPDHIQVAEGVKSVLSFGSFDESFCAKEKYVKSKSIKKSHHFGDSASDGAASKLPLCDNNGNLTASQADHPEYHSRLADVPSPVDTKVSSASVSKDDKPVADNLSVMGPPFPFDGSPPSYICGVIPPLLASTLAQSEGSHFHSHASSSWSRNVSFVSSPLYTPPVTQSTGAGQSPIVSTQLIPFFGQPLPPNFVPYAHYFPPFYAPPNMHQYYGHAGFGNVFFPAPSAATGMEVHPPNYKPEGDAGNQVPSSSPSGYESVVPPGYEFYSSSPVCYCTNASVTSGNDIRCEDLMPNGWEDDDTYPEQQSDGTVFWPAAPNQDIASFPMDSVQKLPPQGQHAIGTESSHGAFPVHHTLQPMGTSTPNLPLMQLSQPLAEPSDAGGPPGNAYQQSKRQQKNWRN